MPDCAPEITLNPIANADDTVNENSEDSAYEWAKDAIRSAFDSSELPDSK